MRETESGKRGVSVGVRGCGVEGYSSSLTCFHGVSAGLGVASTRLVAVTSVILAVTSSWASTQVEHQGAAQEVTPH